MTVARKRRLMLGVVCGVLGVLVVLGAWVQGQRGERLWPALSVLLGQREGRKAVGTGPHGTSASGSGEEPVIEAAHTGGVTSVAFSPDGRLLASASTDHTVLLWSLRARKPQNMLQGHTGPVTAVAFSPDGTVLATGADDATVRLWNPRTGVLQQTLTGHTKEVRAVAFSPDGATLASGAADGTVRLWQSATGALLRILSGHPRGVASVAFAADSATVTVGLTAAQGQEALWHWEVTTGTSHKGFRDPERVPRDGALRPLVSWPSGDTVAWGVGDDIKLGTLPAYRVTKTLEGHREDVMALAVSPDGRRLASGAFDTTVMLWDLATYEQIHTLSGHLLQVKALAFSPDGQLLASASADRTIRLWEPATGAAIATLGTPLDPAQEMWDVQVLSSRREERISAVFTTWTPKAGYTFLLVQVRLKNKLEEPALLYIPGGFELSDGTATYTCKGIEGLGMFETGQYFRSYQEAGNVFSHTLIFVVPTAVRGLRLQFLNLPPIALS